MHNHFLMNELNLYLSAYLNLENIFTEKKQVAVNNHNMMPLV